MNHVYLSYIEQDRESAWHLAQALEAHGIHVSHGDHSLRAGEELNAQAPAAGSVIVLCSRASLKSPTVLADARAGLERGALMLIALEDLGPDDFPAELRDLPLITLEDALYQARIQADDVLPTIESAPAGEHEGDELYRTRIEADDVPPTAGSAPIPQGAWDKTYRARIAMDDDPPTLVRPSISAPRSALNDGLSLDNLVGWTTARENAVQTVPAIPTSEAYYADHLRTPPQPAASAAPSPPQEIAAATPRPLPETTYAEIRAPLAKQSSGPGVLAGFVLSAGIGLVVGLLFATSFSREMLDKLIAMVGFKLNAFPFLGFLSGHKAAPQIDTVDCSVFSPASAPPGATVLVQVFLHIPEQAERAHFMASVMDQAATLKGVQTLQVPIARGSSVTVTLSAAGLDIDEPQQTIVWRGEPVFCQFLVAIPEGRAGRTFHPVVRVSVAGGLVGRIVFALSTSLEAATPQSIPQGKSARRYNHAFLSYASADRKEVLKRAQILEAAGVSFFQDTLKLDPGTRWEREIYRNIDSCDLFLLFWSKSALESQWVLKEAEYALRRQGDGDVPDIVPVILGSPPPLPPASLAAIHFNDRIHYLIGAD